MNHVNRTLGSQLPTKVIEDDSHSLSDEGLRFIIPPEVIDIWTTLEVLLGMKLSGHTDTLTALNVIDDF